MENTSEPEAGQQARRRLGRRWKVGLAIAALAGAATFGVTSQATAVGWSGCRHVEPVPTTVADAPEEEVQVQSQPCLMSQFGVRW